MKTYLFCVDSTLVGYILAETKSEAKDKLRKEYNFNDGIVIDPLDMDKVDGDVVLLEDVFSFTTIEHRNVIGKYNCIKDCLEHIAKTCEVNLD